MLNLLATAVVISGGLITILIHFISGTSMPIMVGIMSGAVTNTPGLGAAQTTLGQLAVAEGTAIPDIGLGYAVAYPFGVLGIIFSMILLRKILKIDTEKEKEILKSKLHPADLMPERINVIVRNPRIFNKSVSEISKLLGHGIVISRVLHNGEILSATSETVVHENDIILVVAEKGIIPDILKKTGDLSDIDLRSFTGRLVSRRLLVTNREVSGRSL